MTDEPVRPRTPATPAPRVEVLPADFARKRDYLPVLYLVGFVVLAGSLVFLWQNPPASRLSRQDTSVLDGLRHDVTALQGRVDALGKGAVSPADFARLQQQVAAEANRPAAATPEALAALGARVEALQARPTVSPDALKSLSDKVSALEARPAVSPQQLADLSDQVKSVASRIPDLQPLDSKIAALQARPTFDPAALAALSARVDAADKANAALAAQLKTVSEHAQVMARLQGMATALAAGRKLGDIPGAPPALQRFAQEAPPTEASLRESFDRYADAAQKASQPAITDNQSFGNRLWTRAQQAVTVRQGDRVLLGDPIAGVLAAAREKLDNGDLAGAVDALHGLAGPAAAAMAPWTDKASALVAARAAIASLAAG